jgi:hypothetical protein
MNRRLDRSLRIDLIDISDFPNALSLIFIHRQILIAGSATRPRTSGRTAPRSAASLTVVANADQNRLPCARWPGTSLLAG